VSRPSPEEIVVSRGGEPAAPLEVSVLDGLEAVDAGDWNRLAGDECPFSSHEFLAALERQGCVGPGTGWQPCHLLARRGAHLVGAMPLYLKTHSQGEFVFDWGWAEAYQRHGLDYYPKLVSAIPFTPATGPRVLVDGAQADGERIVEALAAAAQALARDVDASSVHWLFPRPEEAERLAGLGMLRRDGCQFHWHNPGWRDFEAYLEALSSKRRKEIRRERREAGRAPVVVEMIPGREVSPADWRDYHRLYASTYDRKWGYPALTVGFFEEVGRTLPDRVFLVLGRRHGRMVAGAHLFQGRDALYGRNWGCSETHPCLHFEMCYYRPIEHCLEHGLVRFEAGAQGEHKITRGFLPTVTRSMHWIAHRGFAEAIAEFLGRERSAVGAYVEEMARHSPFRAGAP
jgi:uncharacterized protein